MVRDLDPNAALETARRVLRIECEALDETASRLDENFSRAVDLILHCKGRVVVTGMGKSGQICRKIAATMASTGTSAFFLHAGEAVHGDLGMFARGDVCIAISNSGTTQEVLALLPGVKRLAIPLIAITGGLSSPLAEAADVVIDVRVRKEACPMNLAPTASTTVTLAIGDALSVAVLEAKGFTDRDFAQLHPGGALGRKLMRVEEVMHPDAQVPLVTTSSSLTETLRTMTEGGLGTVGVVDDASGELAGVITDGDIRRAVLRHGDVSGKKASDLMSQNPKTARAEALVEEALATMEKHSITALFILERDTRRPIGIVHLHDLLKASVA
ncbi:MAG TPA: KpsF/GutQ family sugar-phosphate isomerase [Candidatus Limnocylindrales bacterium]|nr:KpsF/GutQ family sugar-phosphate isomerase [Candidatus Limnocylindrales bacterium]